MIFDPEIDNIIRKAIQECKDRLKIYLHKMNFHSIDAQCKECKLHDKAM